LRKTQGKHCLQKGVSILVTTLFIAWTLMIPAAAGAADWETWPRKPGPESGETKTGAETPEAAAAAKAGESGGKAASAGVSAGTIGKWALIGAGVIGIGIALGSGGGGDSGTTTTPTHP